MRTMALLSLVVAVVMLAPLATALVVAGMFTPASVAAVSCGGGAAALGLNAAGGTAPRATGNPRAPLQVRVASWNTLSGNSTGNVVAGARGLGRSADVIGLQELSPASRRQQVAAALHPDFAITSANNAVEILWRRNKFDLIAQGDVRVFGVEQIEPGTAGTSIGPKGVTWVQLRAKDTGATFFTVNTHLVPDIDRRGYPNPATPLRVRLAVRQQHALAAVVDQLAAFGPVFITGDYNVDARRDAKMQSPSFPYVTLGRHGLVSNWRVLGYPQSGTHGRRLIDYVWSTAATAVPVAQHIGPRHGSDHRLVTVTLRKRPKSTPTSMPPAPTPTSSDNKHAPVLKGSRHLELPGTLTVPGKDGRGSITLNREQISYAALAIAEAKAHHIPMSAAVIFLATAQVESGIQNLPYGDRDSVGLVQQRPSTGWGTRGEILSPKLAIDAFYGVATHTRNPGLVDVPNWRSRPLGEVAQAVQVSAFPDRYQYYETTARAIVTALSGTVGTAGAADSSDPGCDGTTGVVGTCPPTRLPAEQGLTEDALHVLHCSSQQFPTITTFHGVGQRAGASDHPSGRAVDLMIPNYKTAAGSADGWQIAKWVRANAGALGVRYVIYSARIWNVDRDREGWRPYHSTTGSANDTSLHYDHVHVNVFGNKGKGPPTRSVPRSPPSSVGHSVVSTV